MSKPRRGGRRPAKRATRPAARRPPAVRGPDEASALRERVAALEGELAEERARTAEGRERETATAEVLRLIAGVATDLPAVLDGIVASAIRLVGAEFGVMTRFDGELFHLVAQRGITPQFLETAARLYPFVSHPDAPSTRAIIGRQPVYIEDGLEEAYPNTRELARAGAFRSFLSLPLLGEGRGIGTINLGWADVRPFPADRMEVLRSFADQAVIAIENVRVFKELEARNTDLGVALEQQTATAEILRVISSSPTDVQPVFDAIARSASQLCNGMHTIVTRFDGELMHLVAQHNPRPDAGAATTRLYPRPLGRDVPSGRAILERGVVHIADVEQDGEMRQTVRDLWARSFLAVPMLRDGRPIGTIAVSRVEAGPFPVDQI